MSEKSLVDNLNKTHQVKACTPVVYTRQIPFHCTAQTCLPHVSHQVPVRPKFVNDMLLLPMGSLLPLVRTRTDPRRLGSLSLQRYYRFPRPSW